MPEIAEVETVRRTLKRQILNKRIKDINILYNGIIMGDIKEFKKVLIDNQIKDIDRVGKWLIFKLEDYSLLSHLRMEGKFFLKKTNEPYEKHEHVIISFEDGTDLRYHDTRKFGKMKLVKEEDLLNTPEIVKQGKEPNNKDLTKEYLYNAINNKTMAIKTLLLDQTIISGLGNIYANEVLFLAKVDPFKKGKDVSINECQKIIDATNKIIPEAIEMGGTTIKSYTSSLGVTGRFQQKLNVHKKDGQECPICHNKVIREKINGRSTYYCKKCQH